jgi:selenocysteine-specific elongation factor
MPHQPLKTDDGAVIAMLRLNEPALTKIGDRFVLRLPTPSLLLGGGMIIDPVLPAFKRSSASRWRTLFDAASLSPDDLAEYQLKMHMILSESELLTQSLFTKEQIAVAKNKLVEEKRVLQRRDRLILKEIWDQLSADAVAYVGQYHKENPHLEAMTLAELETRIGCPKALFELIVESLISQGKLSRFEAGVKLADYSAGLSGDLKRLRDEMIATLSDKSHPARTRRELIGKDRQKNEVFAFLKQRKEIQEFGGLVLLKSSFDRMVNEIVDLIKRQNKITVADARDATGTTRKVVVPLLEEMDRQRVTVRKGDYRELAE